MLLASTTLPYRLLFMFMILTVKKNRLPNICSEFVFVFFFIFIYLFPIELNLHKDTNLDWNLQCPSGFLHTSIHLLITLFFYCYEIYMHTPLTQADWLAAYLCLSSSGEYILLTE